MSSPYAQFIDTTNQLASTYMVWCTDLYERIDVLSPSSVLKEVEQLKHEVSACLEFGNQFQFSPNQDYNWSVIDTYLTEKLTEIREEQVRKEEDGVGSLREVFRQFNTRNKL